MTHFCASCISSVIASNPAGPSSPGSPASPSSPASPACPGAPGRGGGQSGIWRLKRDSCSVSGRRKFEPVNFPKRCNCSSNWRALCCREWWKNCQKRFTWNLRNLLSNSALNEVVYWWSQGNKISWVSTDTEAMPIVAAPITLKSIFLKKIFKY